MLGLSYFRLPLSCCNEVELCEELSSRRESAVEWCILFKLEASFRAKQT